MKIKTTDIDGLTAVKVTYTPMGGVAATDVQAAITELDTEKLAASLYTASDILAKLITVDGAGSELDADTIDGVQESALAKLSGANFTGVVNVPEATITNGALYFGKAADYSEAAGNTGTLYYNKIGGILTLDARSNGGNTEIQFRTSSGGVGATRLSISNVGLATFTGSVAVNGALTASGAIRSTVAGGFNIGNVASVERISYATGTFNFLTAANAFAYMRVDRLGLGIDPATRLHIVGAEAAAILDTGALTDGRFEFRYNGTALGGFSISSGLVQLYSNFGNGLQLNAGTGGGGGLRITNLTNAVDDTAAAAAGVVVGQVYRNGSVLMIRVA